jgi:hypothetical protein
MPALLRKALQAGDAGGRKKRKKEEPENSTEGREDHKDRVLNRRSQSSDEWRDPLAEDFLQKQTKVTKRIRKAARKVNCLSPSLSSLPSV